ncbi:hypothetical protein [Pseudomonas typographi]|uniref:Lipoprotein n=1 Tax=Pseudomonas typographi TaxID=2715964 RepID=A0ABR7Z5B8_9PSED|nr:hypothetical protein [Pseudomonas typographi]MBD1553067.1 hypothetical protein [Pseudomonas typographi]MBD1588406.1 hypothetical protein [Pseudomonas typographi]MBD1600519.1 hypothetical protein [Pseudomonas typographi]
MKVRSLALLGLLGLLSACAGEAPSPPAATAAPPAGAPAPDITAPEPLGPLPAWQRELSGTLTNVPVGAQVELAMLVVDDSGRPQRLLASTTLAGNGRALPFQLRFAPEAFPQGARVELRGRASQAGMLSLKLTPRGIAQATTQNLGQLQMDKAP